MSAGIGGLVFWCMRRRRRRERRNSQGGVIDNVSSGPLSRLAKQNGEATGLTLASPRQERSNNDSDLANVVHPFISHGDTQVVQNISRKGVPASLPYSRGDEHRSSGNASAISSSPALQSESEFTRTERESTDYPTYSVRTPNRNLRITNPEATQEVSLEIASLWNEINRLRQLVPGGGGGVIDEEPPPSYDSERLPQERERLLTARDT